MSTTDDIVPGLLIYHSSAYCTLTSYHSFLPLFYPVIPFTYAWTIYLESPSVIKFDEPWLSTGKTGSGRLIGGSFHPMVELARASTGGM